MSYHEGPNYDEFAASTPMERYVQYPGMLELLGNVAVGARILDLGCGPGNLTKRVYDAHQAAVFGVDFNPHSLEVARKKYPGPLYVRGDINSVPIRSDSMDVLLSNMVLLQAMPEELPRWWSEIHRVLRPGGRAIVSINHPAFLPYSPKDSDRGLDPATFNYNDEKQFIYITTFHPDGSVAANFLDPHFKLETQVNTALATGLQLERIAERTYPPEVITEEGIDPVHGRISNVLFMVMRKSL